MLAVNNIPTRIRNPQKLCDITDWCDQQIDYIIRHHLRARPAPQRRQWEFAMLFFALAREGKLHPKATGLGLGVGTERLIFSIADAIGRVTATDLYGQDSKWLGVRTENPKNHVLSRAPFDIDADRLDVHSMDMRDITYPEKCFDFAWSTGSFEHIGHDDDFLRHLSEVHRVLKPGGVYAFTTAMCFSDDSVRIPGNHYFSPEHLIDLIEGCPLHPEPEFDLSLVETRLNQPIPDRPKDLGLVAARSWLPQVIILRRGIVTAANLVLLRKDDSRPKRRTEMVGWKDSRRFVNHCLEALLKRLWSDWQSVAAEVTPDGTLAKTQPQFLGQAAAAARVLLKARRVAGRGCALEVMVVERRKGWPVASRVIAAERVALAGKDDKLWYEVELRFQTDEDNCYMVEARPRRGSVELGEALVWLRRSADREPGARR